MKFAELLEIVEDEPVFEYGFLVAGRSREPGLPAQLSRWCRDGKLLRLRRGLFSLGLPYRKVIPHPFLVANRIVPGSYVSGLSALAHANAIRSSYRRSPVAGRVGRTSGTRRSDAFPSVT